MGREINEHSLDLKVGVFQIHITYPSHDTKAYYLPYQADQFLTDGEEGDYHYSLHYQIRLDSFYYEPNSKAIAGFDYGPFPYQIYRMDNEDILWIRRKNDSDEMLVYRISKDWSSWSLLEDSTGDNGRSSFNELAYIFAYSILNKGGIMLHGVVMEWNGIGIIISAYSGVGKTTHARMWRDYENALILNGDRALCYKEGNTWYTYGSPWSGTSGEQIQRKVRLKAIVFLEQADENEATVLTSFEGAKGLLQHTFVPYWDEDQIECALTTIDDMVENIPILKLRCKPDAGAVTALKTKLCKIIDCVYK